MKIFCVEIFLQDLRYAVRGLRRSPGFALTAVLTLSLGIGATTAIFSAVYALLIRPLPYRNPARLVWVGQLWHGPQGRSSQMVLANDVFAWREAGHPFESVAVYNFDARTMTGAGDPMWLSVAEVNSEFLTTLGIRVAMGRDFVPSDHQPNVAPVVIVSDSIWKNRLHSDPGAVGRAVNLDGKPYTVIGVLPPRFLFPDISTLPEALIPMDFAETSVVPPDDQGIPSARTIVRLLPGSSIAQARAELEPVEKARLPLYPRYVVGWALNGRQLQLEPLQMHLVGNTRVPVLILLAAVGLVLLIACANVANLQLVRAAARRHEIAVRSALGATRNRVARQLLTESLLVGLVSAAFGLLLAFWIVALMRNLGAPTLPWIQSVGIEPEVFLFSLFVGVFSAAVFGAMPALRSCRVNPAEVLKAVPTHMVSDDRNSTLRRGFLVAEISLALVLLIGAGLLIRSFQRLMRQDLGFEPQNVLIAKVQLPHYRYDDNAGPTAFWTWANSFNHDLLQRLQALPGVRHAAITNQMPLEMEGGVVGIRFSGEPITATRQSWRIAVSPDFFSALGTPLIAGRFFLDSDNESSAPVAIVNRTFAEKFLGKRPVGAHFIASTSSGLCSGCIPGKPAEMQVVGVVADVHHEPLENSFEPAMYVPRRQQPGTTDRIVLSTLVPPLSLVPAVRSAVIAVDREAPVFEVTTMEQRLSELLAQRRLTMFLLSAFAALALLLAAIGVYGVISYAVVQRTREIGIRIALGATPGNTLRLLLWEQLQMLLVGSFIGLALALMLSRVMTSLLYGVKPHDIGTFASSWISLSIVALGASLVPALRATRIDPWIALRYE